MLRKYSNLVSSRGFVIESPIREYREALLLVRVERMNGVGVNLGRVRLCLFVFRIRDAPLPGTPQIVHQSFTCFYVLRSWCVSMTG